MNTTPKWMTGCPGRDVLAADKRYSGKFPSLSGLHQFSRISRKKSDIGKTACVVCGATPKAAVAGDVWEWMLSAEREVSELRGKTIKEPV